MKLSSIVFNDSNRVRSGWRATIFLISCFSFIFAAILLALPIFSAFGATVEDATTAVYATQFTISAAAALFFGWLWGKWFEDLPFRALGAWFTSGWFKDLVAGLGIGLVSLCLAAAIVSVFGGLTFELNRTAGGSAIASTLLNTLLIFFLGAAFEESFFRGYLMQTFFRARYAVFAILFTSVLFATTHNANPGANPLSWLNTFLAGIWLAVAYAKTRNLWFPFGIHLAWNWTQGSLLGITVSGLEKLAPEPLMRAAVSGPEWLSGGNYGIEGGVACTATLLISTVAITFAPFLRPSEEMAGFTSPDTV